MNETTPQTPGPHRAAIARRQARADAEITDRIVALLAERAAARRADIIAAGGDPDSDDPDSDDFETVRAIADEWEATAADPVRRAALVEQLAARLDTSQVRALRLAAEAAVAITPRLVLADAAAGVSAEDTADDLGYTTGRIYQIRRAARGDDRTAPEPRA